MIRSLLAAIAVVLPLAAAAAIERPLEPVYIPSGQYTASLQARAQLWRLIPLDGDHVEVRSDTICPHTALPSRGLWLIGRDAKGRAELVAVSATPLPAEHSGRVALRRCDDPELRDGLATAYGVPAPLLELLMAHSGAVLVDD
jgi:hypothetical protein